MIHRAILCFFLCFLTSACLFIASTASATVFEDFDSIVPNTQVGVPFTVGTAPESATFLGDAFAGVAGVGELYFSGNKAWMVLENGTGVIDFDQNAASVDFWTRLRTGANGSSVYTAYDDFDQVIDSITIDTPGAFQLLSFTGNIDRIEVVNNATGSGQMNSIDDITFTAIPEPATWVFASSAVLLLMRLRRADS